MILAVPKETRPGETRVALVPEIAKKLVDQGWDVVIETGAGDAATFTDDAFKEVGARIAPDAASTLNGANLIVKVNAPDAAEAASYPEGVAVMSFFQAGQSTDALKALVEKKATVISFDLLPRISRAQSMDALSSQATVSGYRAGLAAAEHLAKFFPLFMTAAGTVPPAKVLVMGVGVAGLQAIATARRLGAVVRAYDVRSAAKEEAESLGAKFVDLGVKAEGQGGYARELTPDELAAQQAALAKEVAISDVVITTAAVPGRKAPILVTAAMVDEMGPGSIIIDMAADGGGNCEVTKAGEVVTRGHCRVVGLSNPPAGMPTHASFLYARNVINLLELFSKDGALAPDWADEVVIGTTIVKDGAVANAQAAEVLGATHQPIVLPVAPAAPEEEATNNG
jgi:H+-translocating NAD(P) transhydrogenase subunit alpha